MTATNWLNPRHAPERAVPLSGEAGAGDLPADRDEVTAQAREFLRVLARAGLDPASCRRWTSRTWGSGVAHPKFGDEFVDLPW